MLGQFAIAVYSWATTLPLLAAEEVDGQSTHRDHKRIQQLRSHNCCWR